MKFTYPSGSKTLAGYTIKRGIGRGGFGEVYYATSDAGKEVALKLIQRSLDVELRGVTQCLNLRSPHLVEIYDIRESDAGETWIIMEYVSGGSLEQEIAAHPQGLPDAEIRNWLQGIVHGVAVLHDHGIVHRDLKPGNLFREQGLVKIGDYGLSKFITASRRSAQTESIGTVHYMAPEVARGKYGKEIDVYALGVMLYEMLTGRVPFDGESVGEILMKHLTAEPDIRGLTEPYRTLVARALDKDPTKRFAAVRDMVATFAASPASVPSFLPVSPGTGAAGSVGAGTGHATYPATDAAPVTASPSGREPFWKAPVDFFMYGQTANGNGCGGGATSPPQPLTNLFPPLPPQASPPPAPPTAIAARPVTKTSGRSLARTEPLAALVSEKWALINRDPTSQTAFWLLAVGAFVVPPFAPLVWFASFWGLVVYGVYRLLWTISQTPGEQQALSSTGPSKTEPQRITAQVVNLPVATRVEPAPVARETYIDVLPKRTLREKSTELLGSLLTGAIAASAVAVPVFALLPWLSAAEGIPQAAQTPEQFALLVLATILGTWGVLLPSKAWEGTLGRPMLRRLGMLITGLAVGAAAWGLDQYLLVNLPINTVNAEFAPLVSLDLHGQPTLLGYLAYFGFLFLVPRWWLQADPLRTRSFSLWNVVSVAVWGLLLAWAWNFPQGFGVLWGAIVSVAVQLSAPWCPPAERLKQRTVVL